MHMVTTPNADHARRERFLAFGTVMLVLLLSALDGTIVATAMPRIVADLAGLERIALVGTAYLLTSTVMGPAQGMCTLAIQSAVALARTGVATTSAQFFRQIG